MTLPRDPSRVTPSLAVACLTALQLSPPELVDAAAAAGFDGVSIRMFPPRSGDPLMPVATDAALLAETARRLDDHGCGVIDVEAIQLAPGLDLDAVMPGLEASAMLGARHVLATAGHEQPAAVAEALHALCERCEPLSIRVVLEFMVFSTVPTLEQAVAVVTEAAHPMAGVLVDPLHLRNAGDTPQSVASAVERRPDLFPYAQLCDAPLAAPAGGTRELFGEAIGDRLAPGDGELPLRELLDALPSATPLSVETPVAALAGLPGAERIARVGERTRAWLNR